MNSRSLRAFGAVFRREIATVLRTPGYGLLSVGLLVALFGFVIAGGGGETGFVPAVVDVLVPVELLVPLVAVIFGYRALHADSESGELAVLRTYRIGAPAYVAGIAVARLLAFAAVVGVPLAAVGGYVWVTASPDTGIYAVTRGVDSPALFVRFVAFTLLLGVPYLLFAAAVSAFAESRRGAVAVAVIVFVGGTIGGDLAVLGALSDGLSPETLPAVLGATPNTAFRGLVFEYVVGVATASEGQFVDPNAAIAGLAGWSVLGFVAAVGVVSTATSLDRLTERLHTKLKERS